MSARPRRTVAGIVGRAIFFLLLGLAVAVGIVLTKGVPRWAKDEVLSHLNRGHHTLEAKALFFYPGRGWVLKDARWYTKGRVGPPMLDAEEIIVGLPLSVLFSNNKSARKLTICRGVYRPEMAWTPKQNRRMVPQPWDASFDLQLRDMEYRGVHLGRVDCHVRGKGHKVYVDRILAGVGASADSKKQNLRGNCVHDRRTLVTEGTFDSSLDPDCLLPLLQQDNMLVLQTLTKALEFDANKPPQVSFQFTYHRADGAKRVSVDVAAQAWAKSCAYRGVPVQRVDLETEVCLTPTNCIVTLDPLYIMRPEGSATIGFTVNGTDRKIEFSGASTLAPRSLGQMLGVLTNAWTEKVLLEGACSIKAEGEVHLDQPHLNRITGTVAGDGIGFGKFLAEDYQCHIRSEGRTNHFDDIVATVCSGTLTGAATVAAASAVDPPGYTFRGGLRNADFECLVKSIRDESETEYAGKFAILLDLAGPISPDHAAEVHGSGSVSVEEGRIFRLPLFGGLSSLLAKIIPGLDFVLRQSAMDADFEIAEGGIRTDNLAIDGGVLSLNAHGNYRFDRSLSFLVQVKLLKSGPFYSKLVRLVTWPLSKLLEFRLRGTLDDPNWYPVNFSRELLSKVGLDFGDEIIDDTGDGPPLGVPEENE